MAGLRDDLRFTGFEVTRHRFARPLDAATYIAVAGTYRSGLDVAGAAAIERIIDEELGGTVIKDEDAVVYLTRRR